MKKTPVIWAVGVVPCTITIFVISYGLTSLFMDVSDTATAIIREKKLKRNGYRVIKQLKKELEEENNEQMG